jgi:hypothetical protein
MLRCAALATLVSLSLVTPPAVAQVDPGRNFPATALRGTIVVQQPPELLLNGKPARLAPGARIRGVDNMMLLQGALAGQRLEVHYTRDLTGALLEVWILTPTERARQPWPTSPEQAATWSFDPVAQTWTRP